VWQLLRDPRMSQQVVADMVKTVIGLVDREEERWRLQLNAETALKIQSEKRRLCVLHSSIAPASHPPSVAAWEDFPASTRQRH
jgi:hypothetical protein